MVRLSSETNSEVNRAAPRVSWEASVLHFSSWLVSVVLNLFL